MVLGITAAMLMTQFVAVAQQASGGNAADAATGAATGPIRLRQPQGPTSDKRDSQRLDQQRPLADQPIVPPIVQPGDERKGPGFLYRPGEFERHVERITNSLEVRRLGTDLVLDGGTEADGLDFSPLIPADYVIAPGDEVVLTIWGSVDADLRLQVDRSGRIQVPRVGAILVAGVKYQDLAATIERRARSAFKNFELAVSLGQLRAIRVFVTGFAERPGSYSVSSLSTVSSVLFKAGGPSASGSYRDIELRRNGKSIAHLDIYDLLVHGRRDADQMLQAADVIHVGPAGKQAALIGSVNKAAVFDLKPGETISDLLRMAGGFNSVADRSRLALERLDERSELRVRQVQWPADGGTLLEAGDVVRAFSSIAPVSPLDRQNVRVRIDGEVLKPGEYIFPPRTTLSEAIKFAGGFAPAAYLFGSEFTRESVRIAQQQNYDRALREMEVSLTRASSATVAKSTEEVAAQASQQANATRLLARLRELRPTGRVVLELTPESKTLPELVMESGDQISIAAKPVAVGVFGSVFNSGSFVFQDNRTVDDYLRLAGSPTAGADTNGVFVIRANGSVVSAQQGQRGFFGRGGFGSLLTETVLPGDTVFVPEEVNKQTWVQAAKDWTQILYQFGLGVAGLVTIFK